MFAVQSNKRNLEAEDREVWGHLPPTQQDKADDMNITAAGNVTLNCPQQEPSGSQQPSVAPKPKAGGGWLPKLLLAASLLGGGSGVGYIVHDLLTPVAKPTVDTDTITEFGLEK